MNKENQKVVAVIIARGGSKGVPRKNVRLLAGKPLIAYPIIAAKNCALINRVIVSTDNDEIASVAKEWGGEVPFVRPAELAEDLTATEPVLQHAIKWLDENEKYHTDIMVFLTATFVPRKKGIVEKVVKHLIEHPELDSVFTATPTHKNYWRFKDGQWVRLASDIPHYGSRQTKEPLWREDTPLVCATRADWIRQGKRMGEKVWIIENDAEFSVDIDTEFDFWMAEEYIKRVKNIKDYEGF
ncbi:MAG: Cytidylyltransferase [Parcubacteria group bacterium Gr01-1014_30]|nr:MAG: Cytidylyltransferase [Parcubacteria group bacterium Gr01-1014_30]